MLTNLDMAEAPPGETAEATIPFARTGGRTAPGSISFSWFQTAYLPLRRGLDFSLALVLTVIALPIVVLAALAIRLTSRGPAFYTQIRTGRGGVPFTIYKLRTMIDKCESLTGPRWTIPGDSRVTPLGWLLRRTHIDELPQLLNVLKGEMSLIGPRPERPEFVGELSKALPGYDDRHAVLPGITGLAQVQLPPDSDIESVRQKLICDLHYVRHFSLWLDARILLATGLHALGMSFGMLTSCGIVPVPKAAVSSSDARMQKQHAA